MLSNPFKEHKNCLSLYYEHTILGYLLLRKLLLVRESGWLVKTVKRLKKVSRESKQLHI